MALPDAMAEMIPDALPASSTAGEGRVFATLARLPDDCLIYYEPVVRRRYPDLIAILREVGVLVIEVKDWRLAEPLGRCGFWRRSCEAGQRQGRGVRGRLGTGKRPCFVNCGPSGAAGLVNAAASSKA